jgi:hypothetical protein
MKVKIPNPFIDRKIDFNRYVGFKLVTDDKGFFAFVPPDRCGVIASDLRILGVVVECSLGFIIYDDGRAEANRDNNGSLLCSKCNEPFPYAEPDGASFTCYQCRNNL